MNSKTHHWLFFITGIFYCLSFSCNQETAPCLIPKTASLGITCVHFPIDTSTITIDTALPYATFTAFTAGGLKPITYSTPNSFFTLSLSTVSDSCIWQMSTDSTASGGTDTLLDTLHFYYQKQLNFLSNACGYTYFFTLDSIHTTHHSIDSAIITNPSVTNDVNVTTQLTVYIHPDY